MAHLGIGAATVKTLWRKVPLWPLLLGTVLPDLIDKPLYYAVLWFGSSVLQNCIPGTRTIGHTGIFCLAFSAIAFFTKNKKYWALTLGISTHLLLDVYGVEDLGISTRGELHMLLWPFFGWSFPTSSNARMDDFWNKWTDGPHLAGEILGFLALAFILYTTFFSGSFTLEKPDSQREPKK